MGQAGSGCCDRRNADEIPRRQAAIDDEKRIPGAYHVPNTPSPPSGNSAEGEGEAAQRRGLPMTPGTIQLESLHSQVEDLSSRLREAEAQRTKAEQERDRAQRLLETYHERDMGAMKEEQDRMEKLHSKGFRGVDINSLMRNPIEEREPREFGF